MSVNIEMPKLSDTMTEGTIIKWHKQVGDSVEIGDVIAEIETDKATMEMEAFDDGTLTDILIPEGGKAAIGSVLAVLDGDVPDAAPSSPTPAPAAPSPAAAPAAPATSPTDHSTTPAATGERVKSSPLARKIASETGLDIASLSGSGPGGRVVKADVLAASTAPTPAPATSAAAATQTPAPVSPVAAAAALAAAAKAKATSPAPAPAPATAPTPAAFAAPQSILPVAKDGDQRIELYDGRDGQPVWSGIGEARSEGSQSERADALRRAVADTLGAYPPE